MEKFCFLESPSSEVEIHVIVLSWNEPRLGILRPWVQYLGLVLEFNTLFGAEEYDSFFLKYSIEQIRR